MAVTNRQFRTHLLGLFPLAAISACALTPPSEDPVQIQLQDMDRRLAAIERILANGSLVELTVQSDEIQRQTAQLQGRIETLEHETQSTAGRQRDLYVDLDERILALEEAVMVSVAGAGNNPAAGQLPVPGGSDRDNYQAALELIKEQRYDAAETAFKQFLITFPDSQMADNAQYWLAEAYYVTDRFDEALRQFTVVVNDYPRSRKVPDALLKMGFCSYELKRWNDARAALTRVQSEFADTTAARLAEQRLKRMSDEGH
jgi:tol-pal system protein YbgF